MVYKHGAYAKVNETALRAAEESLGAIVYVGTAPVHLVTGGAQNVNIPIVVRNISEAREYLGYSDDWASYSLCEAMHTHFELSGVGPLIMINVLDPDKHKSSESGSVSKKPENGRITIPTEDDVILDTIKVTGKTKGTDYLVSYDFNKKTVNIVEASDGSLGTANLTITYDTMDPSSVTAEDFIGDTDDLGQNTGLYVVRDVYQAAKRIPAYLVAPGFSSIPAIHKAMHEVSQKVNGHWDMYMFVDLPIVTEDAQIQLNTAAAYKKENGYVYPNETVYFPMVTGTDGKKYHLSTLAAANFQRLLIEQDGIPYRTVSNTECAVIQNLYLGEDAGNRFYDDTMINNHLNKNGIASAAYVGGRWAIWGAHSADYAFSSGTKVNVSETNRMMLYYISNDFQQRRVLDVDRMLTANDIRAIISEEQARLDALIGINALTFGEVHMGAEMQDLSDIMNGDFTFVFDVTTTPLAKSLTAYVNWTEEGFITYFESITEVEEE